MTWFGQGRYDLKAAINSKNDRFFEWACFQSQQAVEKALKAVIIHGGWTAPRTHKLSVLIGLSNNANPRFRKTQFVYRDLEVFTFVSRYPFLLPGESRPPHEYVTIEDADRCLHQAEDITHKIADILGQPCDPHAYKDVENLEKVDLEKRLKAVKQKITQAFDPEKIILYGGYARGKKDPSTLDILVIADTDLQFVDRIRKVREITKGGQPVVEPVVYTRQEFEQLIGGDGEGFLENALAEGREL